MPNRVVIAVDLGTTGCRAVAFDEAGARLGSHYVEYGVTHPEPGAAEQEAEGWWSATRTCIKGVVAQMGAPESVVALGLSAQGHSWVPTSEDLRPLRPALTWLDTRASDVARELLAARGAPFWGQRVGKTPGPWHMLAQLLWLRERERRTVEEAAHYLLAHDFLCARLTGRPATDFTNASTTLLFSLRDFEWDRSLAWEHLIDARRLPAAHAAGSVAGPLGWEVARDLGLPAAIPVAVGAQDQKCAALAAGLEEGVATVSLGTATAITALARRPSFDQSTGIPCFPYLWRDSWVLEAPLTTTGGALRWLRDFLRLWGCGELEYGTLTQTAAGSPPGSNGVRFLPFLAGAGAPHWVGDARGGVVGLGLDTSPADVVRALLEGVAFEIRTNLEAMRGQGVQITGLRLFGGGARSDLWAALIADVTALPVERTRDVEMSVAGAAMLAFAAAGVADGLTAARELLCSPCDRFDPLPDCGYDAFFADYSALREGFWRMTRATRPGRAG